MPALDANKLASYRAFTYRTTPERRLTGEQDAIRFVNERGFVYFWPIKNTMLPSLWVGFAGDRDVPNDHDDPGHTTWRWKDNQLDKRNWYYAKLMRGKSTMVAFDTVPYLYALSENYGEPEEDYLIQYNDGLMTHHARQVYESLLVDGPAATVTLRQRLNMTSSSHNSKFNKALVDLQRDFKILPVGIAPEGAWRYSFIYSPVHRYYPALVAQARAIGTAEARMHLVARYLESVGAATERDVRLLFQWKRRDIARTLAALVADNTLLAGYTLANQDDVYVWPGVFN